MSDFRPYPDMPPAFSVSAEEGLQARAGEKLAPEETKRAEKDDIINALRQVYDPEIPVNLYDLGLIYEIDLKPEGDVQILMTVTAPACPVAGEMPGQVANAVAPLEGVGVVTVTLTWQPAWTPDRMSEDARMSLGI